MAAARIYYRVRLDGPSIPAEADRNPEPLSAVIDLMIRNGTNWNRR